MAIKTLSNEVIEYSTCVMVLQFRNEDGQQILPISANWSLMDRNGNIINEKEDITIDLPSEPETVYVVLSGNDLPNGYLYFIIDGTYYNNISESTEPLRDSCKFYVRSIAGDE